MKDNIEYNRIITEPNRLRMCLFCNKTISICKQECQYCYNQLPLLPNQLPLHYIYRYSSKDGCIYFINLENDKSLWYPF